MTAEGTFPKIDGDILYASEINNFYNSVFLTFGSYVFVHGSAYSAGNASIKWAWSDSQAGGGYTDFVPASGNYVEYKVFLIAGTYDCNVGYGSSSASGIVSCQLDTVEFASTDFYAASPNVDAYTITTGISVATTGLHTIKFISTTKHASSSNYNIMLHGFTFRKTA